ncbi:sigma-54-dependent transcriptional regulator [Desulfopila aestuarii]|uniref:DNA-binding transcriptional response regulator, NtrC family, contains REC, AAA-type ATPase, and a Fis-type DNA-binding domains n=1 Tax=Desulfopila aestuarii DSM 18488 TaxID=1121416 RepID=A0A1M7Y1A2_9BACT|nr:sigma-54 dependent transcriptional regulator [Desulfopila aestuarii]SHO45533.1 DNA-binding transcriptional response regulator, NtrC family, contains REC, AAA-type ATPase, and a Fis-type DNA-binding domains [Desulfopila aestuarii DSM 18488]
MSKNQYSLLIVDDDINILEVLDARLTAAGYTTYKAADGMTALTILGTKNIDLVVSDVKMPNISGLQLFHEIESVRPGLPVIFLTAYGSIPEAVSAVQAGAIDYLTKPFDGKTLVGKIRHCLANLPTKSEVESPLADTNHGGFIWGRSPRMAELRNMVMRVAASKVNTLILGESGVGKECIARAIHRHSERSNGPFVVIDCGSTPAGILESELFGHTRGAFTSAVSDKKGLIEAAHGGTLFLDEIGNISPEMQHRLLRFLEEKIIRKVGSVEEQHIECRVLAATNANIVEDVELGKFRQDLYYRLRVVTLNIPPLRERQEDIETLVRFFVESHYTVHNLPPVTIPDETMRWIRQYSWPGNVRQLRNALEAGVVLCADNILRVTDLQLETDPSLQKHSGSEVIATEPFSLETSEKEAIIRALKATNGVQIKAAALLNISRRSMHDKIKKYEIIPSDYK